MRLLVSQILSPAEPHRTSWDEQGLFDLGQSMKKIGQLQPIGVIELGEGLYECVYGHRRLEAARLVGFLDIECVVYPRSISKNELMLAENLHREDLTFADEATQVSKLFDVLGQSITAVCRALNKSRTWVEARLDYLQFPDYLRLAVDKQNISITSARMLLRVDDEVERKRLLNYAIMNGATTITVDAWVQQYLAQKAITDQQIRDIYLASGTTVPPDPLIPCGACGENTPLSTIEYFRVCPQCLRGLIDAFSVYEGGDHA